ncbi:MULTISPECIES: aldehyde dehydrogenase family protein [Mesorhizobium]|uniref:aldehyde dehydrogenase family protein n=1 Tax=Rhizobium loti TaxID=381 RepID=UPI002477FCCB|nr:MULTISPECIES: aldehyde dehydrogenase family protein [Mesorhizobium]
MDHHHIFFIDGKWIELAIPSMLDVIDPSTEQYFPNIAVDTRRDVDRAVAAAKAAFLCFSQTTREDRLHQLRRILEAYNERHEDMAQAVSREMGAPITLAHRAQTSSGRLQLEATIAALKDYVFSEKRGTTVVVKEPIGVCALITPWNWPLNQIVCKAAPAIAAGCTVLLKPSEIAPISGIIFSEVMEAAGTPKGVCNMINGTGPEVGQVMAAHVDVDMASFTGSTRAGIIVAKTATDTVKRVAQELGGKSPNIILSDADFGHAVRRGVESCLSNSGQSCDAPTRMLVPADRRDDALAIAKEATEAQKVGDPRSEKTKIGPVFSNIQFDKLQRVIDSEGERHASHQGTRPARTSQPRQLCPPTVFGHVKPGIVSRRMRSSVRCFQSFPMRARTRLREDRQRLR